MLGIVTNLDAVLYLWFCQSQRYPRLVRLARLISRSGDGHLYGLFGVTLLLKGDPHSLLILKAGLLAFLFEIPGFIGLKALIRRDRPFVRTGSAMAAIKPADKFSMPSGHAAAAFLMATLLGVLFSGLLALCFCWAALVGLSRVVLGVHYPGDILAGAMLGSACALLGTLLATGL
jgi:undecaprenyl-diphosphatase